MVPLPISWVKFPLDAALGDRSDSQIFAEVLSLDILCYHIWRGSCLRGY